MTFAPYSILFCNATFCTHIFYNIIPFLTSFLWQIITLYILFAWYISFFCTKTVFFCYFSHPASARCFLEKKPEFYSACIAQRVTGHRVNGNTTPFPMPPLLLPLLTLLLHRATLILHRYPTPSPMGDTC